MSKIITKKSTKAPLLNIKFLSHGTLESRDLQASRRFYEEVLGLEVIQHLPNAMTIRHGSNHTYVVVQTNNPKGTYSTTTDSTSVQRKKFVLPTRFCGRCSRSTASARFRSQGSCTVITRSCSRIWMLTGGRSW